MQKMYISYMKRFATVLFVIVVFSVSTALVLYRKNIIKQPTVEKEESISMAKTIVPLSENSTQDKAGSNSNNTEATSITSLIPLLPTETLLAIQDIDFNEDGYDDQVNAVKRSNSTNLTLVVCLFNPATSNYERTVSVDTIVSQINTFSFFCMDITGTHKNALIYTGITDSNLSVLQAFQSSESNGTIVLTKIADIQTYGSVSIQQISRSDAYALSQANGDSFPIIESVSDPAAEKNSLDQLQIEYNWDRRIGQYVKKSEIRIPGKKIAADVLASIQDGTVGTFTSFLNGLWYQTSSTSGIRYVFFNKQDNEIIFLLDDTEEVYNWDNSTLRRNGIYLSSVNMLITNLKRRIDITLTGIDEIKIKLDDDVGMTIKTDNLWDGQYKKMSVKSDLSTKSSDEQGKSILELLEKTAIWQTADGISVNFADNLCTTQEKGNESISRIALLNINGDEILQFQKLKGSSLFNGAYKLISGETITFVPVDMTLTGWTQSNRVPILLTQTARTE